MPFNLTVLKRATFTVIGVLLLTFIANGQKFGTANALIEFVSNAPLEIISANSKEMQGLLDVESKRFAFKIYIKSFEGFNSNLQKIHFYENYMETDEYPISTFAGKIIENIEVDRDKYRAKGILDIHGVSQEVIISVSFALDDEEIQFESNFQVRLEDHEISIPKLVNQKIAEIINVKVSGVLILRE